MSILAIPGPGLWETVPLPLEWLEQEVSSAAVVATGPEPAGWGLPLDPSPVPALPAPQWFPLKPANMFKSFPHTLIIPLDL